MKVTINDKPMKDRFPLLIMHKQMTNVYLVYRTTDETPVDGTNAINLSTGQDWRIDHTDKEYKLINSVTLDTQEEEV